MSSDADNPNKKARRPVVFLLVGLLLFAAAGFLASHMLRAQPKAAPSPKTYEYHTEQSMQNNVRYRQSSFFSSTPGATNTAYIADLTDSINARLHYKFQANQTANLSYAYDAKAVIQSTYTNHNSEDTVAKNVWTKQFDLIKPTTGNQQANTLQLSPAVIIPYTDYRQLAQQFNDAIDTPINSQLVVTLSVRVQGTVNDAPFEDRKVSTITLPLDQQVYTLAAKFIRSEDHQIKPKHTPGMGSILSRYELAYAVALLGLAVVCSIYGVRKQTITSPYQRELEKIYRLHDGIIVKASRADSLNHKTVVMVQSFDDLLNIEEEIKTPIIASKVSDATTHFLITRDDIAYVYTLGFPAPFKPPKLPAPAPEKPAPEKKDPPEPRKQTYLRSRIQ